MNTDFQTSHKSEFKGGIPRAVECAIAAVGLFVLLPVYALCALLVKISSPGPVLFKQNRVGRGRSIFTLYKFRTMVAAEAGSLITAEGDCRITPIGRILRKTKLDEIPELYNVLRGDMSFVGPRPEVLEYVDASDPIWDTVLSVRPGITDPVTLQMRNEEAFLATVEDKEKFYRETIQPFKLSESIKYLERRTALRDIGVILKTFKVIVFPHSAGAPKIEEAHVSLTK